MFAAFNRIEVWGIGENMSYKTSIKLNENIVGILCYLGFWITGVIFLLIEKENKFVRFHALQSVILFMPLSIIVLLIAWIPVIGWLLADLTGMLVMFIMLILMVKAQQGAKFKLPIVGKIAYNHIYR